jgi:hypothetical protein
MARKGPIGGLLRAIAKPPGEGSFEPLPHRFGRLHKNLSTPTRP